MCSLGDNGEDGNREEWIRVGAVFVTLHLFQVTYSWNLTKLLREKIRSLLSVVSLLEF